MDGDKLLAYLAVVAIAMSGSAASFRLLYASLDDASTFVAGALALALVIAGAAWGTKRAGRVDTPYW